MRANQTRPGPLFKKALAWMLPEFGSFFHHLQTTPCLGDDVRMYVYQKFRKHTPTHFKKWWSFIAHPRPVMESIR